MRLTAGVSGQPVAEVHVPSLQQLDAPAARGSALEEPICTTCDDSALLPTWHQGSSSMGECRSLKAMMSHNFDYRRAVDAFGTAMRLIGHAGASMSC